MQQADKETFGISIMFTCIMAGLQWLLLWLTHWSIALIVTELIAFFVVNYFLELSNSNVSDLSPFLNPFFLIGGALLCTLWGLCYLMHKPIPYMVIFFPLSMIVTFSIGRYIYDYLKIRLFWDKNYSLCKLEIENKSEGLTFIQYIKFNNSSRHSMDIDPNNIHWPTTYIPKDMDQIAFRFHTTGKNNSEVKEFPFDYSLCQEKSTFRFDLIFWIRKKSIAPIKLTILPNNKVDLYIDNQLIQQFELL